MNNAHVPAKNLIVKSSFILDPTQLTPVEDALVLAQDYLHNFAIEPDFGQKMVVAFGQEAEFDSLKTAWLAGDFSDFPEIEIRHTADINGANGAFAAATNRIYLSQEFINSNTSQPHAIANVLLEEFGHWVDSRINLADTPGDEGEIFSVLVRGENFNQHQLQALKSEDDTALVSLDGQVVQIEQSTVPNQVLWSQRIGKSFGDTFSIGSLVGLPNAQTWNTQDIFGKPLRSLGLGSLIKNDVLGLDTSFGPISMPEIKVPKISLAGAVSAEANAKLSIAGANNSSQAGNIKAGLQVNAGYSLGEVKWSLPLFTDTSLGINNGFLDFQSTLDKRGAFFDYISPYFKLDVQGIFQSKAAAYITGGASLEYIDVIKSLFSFKKTTNTKSVNFNEKIPLSAKLTHKFVDFDTRKNKQVIDWITGKKTYYLGESGIKSKPIDLGKYLNFGFNLPNLNNIDFQTTLTSDSYKFSASVKAKDLIKFDLKLDDIIADKLPIPTSIGDSKEYEIFGQTFGYNYNLSLFDASLNFGLDAEFTVDFTISDLKPKLYIDGVLIDELKQNPNFLTATDTTILALDKNNNDKLDIKLKLDPILTANVNSFLTPKINLTTGIGQVAFNLKASKYFDKKFKELLIPVSNTTKALGKIDLLSKPVFSKYFSELEDLIAPNINLASLLEYNSQIDLNLIRQAIDPNLKLYSGTPSPDYLPGTDLNEKPNQTAGLQGDSDVAQLSPGFDNLDGGTEDSPVAPNSLSYEDPFDKNLLTVNIPNGDIFILDSDIYSLANGEIRLFAGKDAGGNFFELDLDGKSGITNVNGPDTQLRDFERLILSDEVKANSQGIKLNLASLDDFGFSFNAFDPYDPETEKPRYSYIKPHLYLGGVPKREAYSSNAPLSTSHLTTTQGSDYLAIPVGYNDVPYILGDGDDVITFFPNGSASNTLVSPWPYTPGTPPNRFEKPNYWSNPYKFGNNNDLIIYSSYRDVIDLGGGNNKVFLTNVPGSGNPALPQDRYDAFITSVNLGGTNEISGDLSSTIPNILLINFGGSVKLDIKRKDYLTGHLDGLFSGGGNRVNIQDIGSTFLDDVTFVLESQGLQNKFGISEIQEVEVELSGSQISYRTPDASLTLVDNLDPDSYYNITIASADLAGSSIQKELGSDKERYSLQGPANQTYIVGKVTENPNKFAGDFHPLSLRGKLVSQKEANRKVVLRNDLNQRVRLYDLIDELVLEGANALQFFDINSRADYGTIDLSRVDFSSLTNPLGNFSNGWFDSLISGSDSVSSKYVHEIVYSDNSDRVGLNTQNSYSPSPITGSFLSSPFATYAPQVTHKLGGGDDLINGNEYIYEFFYVGSGNNTVVNPDYTDNQYQIYDILSLNAYQPGTGAVVDDKTGAVDLGKAVTAYSFQFGDSTSVPIPKPPFGDVVVYTEGTRSDYVIQRSQTKPNAIEVTKKDGTKDTLFGVSLIKFETEDVSLIPVSDSITAPVDTKRIDIFGNDLKSRLFYSHVVRPDGESFDIQLDKKWAVDRVDVTQQEIYQAGTAPTSWSYDLPIGLTEFSLTKEFLLKEFKDADISVKKLYTLNRLTISELKVTQKVIQGTETVDLVIPVEIINGRWVVKSANAITLESFPLEISYIINEPEGYSHYVQLSLKPSEVVNLEDLRTIFQAGVFDNEFNGNSKDDNILGSDIGEIIRGNGGLNIIYGGGGNDQLLGGDDSDFISGDAGSDVIYGGASDDLIDGDGILDSNSTPNPSAANDVIDGGEGDDILFSGIGDDRIIPGKGDDLIDAGEGTDTGVASSKQENYKLRKRLDGSVVVIDRRTTEDNEGLELYRNTEQFEFSDRTFTIDEVPSSEGSVSTSEDQTQVNATTSQGNFQLKSMEGGKILSLDLLSLEDLIIDQVILAKSLAVLDKYRNTQGEKFNTKSPVIEFLVKTPDDASKEVIEVKLEQEQAANTFVKIKPSTGETFQFNYNPKTGLGAELIDTNGNGLVDLVKIHVKDGGLGDADGTVNGIIYDPGLLAQFDNNSPTLNNAIADITAIEDTAFSFTIPANTFSDIDVDAGDILTYSATLKDGSNLPSWLKFNSATRTFTGIPTNANVGSFTIEVRATDNYGVSATDTFLLAVENKNGSPTFKLSKIADDIFNIFNSSGKSKLKVTLTERSSNLVNELGAFTVDDAQGNINGIAPGAAGYSQAALDRAKIIFSTIANLPNGFNTNNLTHLLEFNSGENLRFYLVRNSTTDAVRAGVTPLTDILFSDPLRQKITDLGSDEFSLAWTDKDGNSTAEFKDLVVKIQSTNDSLPLGTNLQGKPQGEVIDLRGMTSQIKADFAVNREADFNNFIGFYQVTDENGGIDTNGDGKVDILTGQAGYTEAAIRGRVAGIDLTVNNQDTATYTGAFQPGSIFAPFIIANGSPDALLDSNPNNDPAVYFPFLGANTDKVDHIRLLGNNVFGFEDLANGGDKDFNDVIVQVKLSIV